MRLSHNSLDRLAGRRNVDFVQGDDMLIEFSVKNYRSYNERVTFSMLGGPGNELPKHIFEECGFRGLRSAVIYGANASGKSNLLKALKFMRSFIMISQIRPSTEVINVEPFMLEGHTMHEPSEFEVSFVANMTIHKYGFTATSAHVIREWLIIKKCTPRSQEKKIFERIESDFTYHPDMEDNQIAIKYIKQMLRPNALLIGLLDQVNYSHAVNVMRFAQSFSTDSESKYIRRSTLQFIGDEVIPLEWLEKFLKVADIGIDSMSLERGAVDNDANPRLRLLVETPSRPKVTRILTKHRFYNRDSKEFEYSIFDLESQESKGTNRLLDIGARLYPILKNGGVLLVDEIDTSLHYNLTRIIIQLFQTPETNPNNAQLIFTTHDVNHLNKQSFRRDEIWFTEKDDSNSTRLFSLADFRVRKDASFDLEYLRGRYGAVPSVDFNSFASLIIKDK